MGAPNPRTCDACGANELALFADIGDIPVECGVHFATYDEAVASPVGRVVLGYCPNCAYVRNLAFDESLVNPGAPSDLNLYHSAAFRSFCSQLIGDLVGRLPLAGSRVLEIGCAQGEFLRELCRVAGCTGVGYDPSYAGPTGPDPDGSGAELHRGVAPIGTAPDAGAQPEFDVVVSRFVLEHVADPYGFLVALRRYARDRVVHAHLQVPDAGYDLSTAGWEVIYPHISCFGGASLVRIARRAGWWVLRTDAHFGGLIRSVDLVADGGADASAWPAVADASARSVAAVAAGTVATAAGIAEPVGDSAGGSAVDAVATAERERLLIAIGGFAERHHDARRRWRHTIDTLAASGARPVLWGAGSRGLQLLNLADPARRLAAVVDVNPAKWGRYLPVTGHRVDDPASLAEVRPTTVIITNPVYRDEIAQSLARMGLAPDIVVA